MDTPVLLVPGLCLLGNIINLKLSQSSRKFIDITLAVSRKCIASTWKVDFHLSIAKSEMSNCIPLEKITYAPKNGYDVFFKIW